MRLVEGVARVDDVDAFVRELTTIGDDHEVTVQAFDARYVVSRAHLERALELTDRAFDRGENVARDRGVEILLYAAGRRQIDRALALGVSTGEKPVVVLIDGSGDAPDDGATDDNETTGDAASADEASAATAVAALLDPQPTLGAYDDERVREYYDIGDPELEAVEGGLVDVVLERVALLDVEK